MSERTLCDSCACELTSADWEAGACTQCGNELEARAMSETDCICMFCGTVMIVYWLPDSDPEVCHVACNCGASGPWAESVTKAAEKYVEVAAMLE